MQGKVTALIPCFNEEKRISAVLDVVTNSPSIDEVVVVNDGSTDNSEEIIKQYEQVRLISLPLNMGKGGAVREGLKMAKTPITFLCDANLSGLREEHIKKIIEPVRAGDVEVCVGVRVYGGPVIQWFRCNVFPLIAGERVIKTYLLKKIVSHAISNDFGLEPYMNFYCSVHGIKTKIISLRGVKGVYKIKKGE